MEMIVAAETNIILDAKNITKRYPLVNNMYLEVLKGITLKVEKGETIAVVGPSGVGKSTLLHILGGLDRPDDGEVWFGKKNIFKMNDEDLAKFRNREIGFVFQFHHLLTEFTALENVFMPGLIGRKSISEATKRAKELLEIVGLSDRISHFPSELSGGEQQRVAVARALMNNPKILFADEPSGNLDRQGAQNLHELLWKLNKDVGITLLIVTHNMELAERTTRKITLIDGKIDNIRK